MPLKTFSATIEDGALVLRIPIRVETVSVEKRDDVQRAMEELTKREWEVFKLLRRRMGNKEIGNALHVSDRTVKFHVTSIFRKVGCSSRAEVIYKFGNED